MNERFYNAIANGLMLIGIISALLFDSGRISHAIAGTIGIVAGVAAILLYFGNQSSAKERTATKGEAQRAVGSIETSAISQKLKVGADAATFNRVEMAEMALRNIQSMRRLRDCSMREAEPYRTEALRIWALDNEPYQIRSFRKLVDRDVNLMTLNVELSPNEVVACALELIRNLAVRDNQWEYVVGPKGLFVKKAHAMRSTESQKVLDFDLAESLAS